MKPPDLILTPRGLRCHGRILPCAIGRSGLCGDKREGDGATPFGTHTITGCLYRPDRLPAPGPWAVATRPGDLWSDDAARPDYNSLVRTPHTGSHENLRRPDPLYDIVLLTDWNLCPATPGRGSAIFVHQWRKPRHPTEGCIAMRRDHLIWLAARAAPGTRLIIPQVPSLG